MGSVKCVNWQEGNLYLAFYVQPKASQDKIVGLYQDHIKIQITAPPLDNKANQHLQKWLAKQFKTPSSCVSLEKGQTSRYKVFCIQQPRQIPTWLSQITSKD
ncbi:MAG: YggU family protein [Gammaproteobacteria bacterium 39-13]|nr:YggU family protein [Gammaproteobacteria bacterium]OJV90518.1 MAG: YggU family protein [Gammaproteobacteria bacterium 39-13]